MLLFTAAGFDMPPQPHILHGHNNTLQLLAYLLSPQTDNCDYDYLWNITVIQADPINNHNIITLVHMVINPVVNYCVIITLTSYHVLCFINVISSSPAEILFIRHQVSNNNIPDYTIIPTTWQNIIKDNFRLLHTPDSVVITYAVS